MTGSKTQAINESIADPDGNALSGRGTKDDRAIAASAVIPRTGSRAQGPWDVEQPHILPITVRAEDTDAMGHTNNVVYLGWLERVAWSHSEQLGMGFERYQALNTGCVARRHELDYLAPTFVGEELLVGTWIAENDRRISMWRGYQVIRPIDGRTVMRARTMWVCVDLTTGRPRRQPAEFLEAYQATVSPMHSPRPLRGERGKQ